MYMYAYRCIVLPAYVAACARPHMTLAGVLIWCYGAANSPNSNCAAPNGKNAAPGPDICTRKCWAGLCVDA